MEKAPEKGLARGKSLSTAEVAKFLGISRIAVFKKIRRGTLRAKKTGRNYAVTYDDLMESVGKTLGAEKKRDIEHVVARAMREYGEAFQMLGKE